MTSRLSNCLRRRWCKVVVAGIVGLLLWLLFVAWSIWHFGHQDGARRSDCIIVLGAAVHGTQPSPVFEERIKHAIQLHQRGLAPIILFTGAAGTGSSHAESQVGAHYAAAQGIPATAILMETNSHTTRQNLVEAKAVMDAKGLQSAIIVSDPLHLKRASEMAKDLGMSTVCSPTPTTRYRSLGTKLRFLMRELYFLHHYHFTGQ